MLMLYANGEHCDASSADQLSPPGIVLSLKTVLHLYELYTDIHPPPPKTNGCALKFTFNLILYGLSTSDQWSSQSRVTDF